MYVLLTMMDPYECYTVKLITQRQKYSFDGDFLHLQFWLWFSFFSWGIVLCKALRISSTKKYYVSIQRNHCFDKRRRRNVCTPTVIHTDTETEKHLKTCTFTCTCTHTCILTHTHTHTAIVHIILKCWLCVCSVHHDILPDHRLGTVWNRILHQHWVAVWLWSRHQFFQVHMMTYYMTHRFYINKGWFNEQGKC